MPTKPQIVAALNGDSWDPNAPWGDNWGKLVPNSIGELVERPAGPDEQVNGNPKYPQNLTNVVGQTSKNAVWQRAGNVFNLFDDIRHGNRVTTAQMVDALNGTLDFVQGINVLKGILGMSTNTRAPEGSAGDLSYLMKPGES